MRLKVCTCNCVKSLKIGGISPMIKPQKLRLLALQNMQKKCKMPPSFGSRRPIHSPSYSVNLSHKISDTALETEQVVSQLPGCGARPFLRLSVRARAQRLRTRPDAAQSSIH